MRNKQKKKKKKKKKKKTSWRFLQHPDLKMQVVVKMTQQNIFDIYLAEAVLTSIYNLCFGEKQEKIGLPCKPQFSL